MQAEGVSGVKAFSHCGTLLRTGLDPWLRRKSLSALHLNPDLQRVDRQRRGAHHRACGWSEESDCIKVGSLTTAQGLSCLSHA